MRILILGGDGYLGWPTAMHLSSKGHEVAVADNYLRRKLCQQVNAKPLFSVPNLDERADLWGSISGFNTRVFIGDLNEWSFIEKVFSSFTPDVIIHYAE
ncbi:MAG: NAD-dependent epimerase/dehydratase family protein, partial [Deltaproteobacteria bacterium]|nr:NAD-dependent epimerase/dehydratase family protein [Deltaproteobacteria bacterium]